MSKDQPKKDEPLNGEEAIAQFSSQAQGFSNPNAEPKEEPKKALVTGDGETPEPEEMTYGERLEKLEISEEDAQKIIDDICEQGSYIEKVPIRKARDKKPAITAVFRTRDTRTQGFIALQAARGHKNVPMIYEKIMGEYQLAGSLVHYNGTTFEDLNEIKDEEEFERKMHERVTALAKLPAPITVVLGRELSKFDLKVAAVMAPGFEDFF